MTRDEVIKLALEAGLPFPFLGDCPKNIEQLERFAELVAAAERDECLFVAGEAKECAVMSKYSSQRECLSARSMAQQIEDAIRARGSK